MTQEEHTHISLSWSPDESPASRDEMRAAVDEAIDALAGCQALFVAPEAHPHVHIMIKPERPSQAAPARQRAPGRR